MCQSAEIVVLCRWRHKIVMSFGVVGWCKHHRLAQGILWEKRKSGVVKYVGWCLAFQISSNTGIKQPVYSKGKYFSVSVSSKASESTSMRLQKKKKKSNFWLQFLRSFRMMCSPFFSLCRSHDVLHCFTSRNTSPHFMHLGAATCAPAVTLCTNSR